MSAGGRFGALLACAILAGDPAPAAAQAQTAAAEDAAPGAPGRFLLQLQPRYSFVDQSNKPLRAEAKNMRTLVGYSTAPVHDFSLTAQLVDVSWHHPMRANNRPGNSATPYPLVGDPDKTDVNLLYADYAGFEDTKIRVGRQSIKLDNERFVSDADVRQMPQVFDAVSVRNRSLPNTELFAAYAWHVRTYFGNRFSTGTTLLNARHHLDAGPVLGAYAYLQDQPQINIATGFADNSNRIVGARLEGNFATGETLRWYYTAEAAAQRPYSSGDSRIRANYHRLAAGPSWSSYSAQLNYERLGSNQGLYGFQMPLSYNNFQGWANQFLATPAQGVRDLNVALTGRFDRLQLWLKHHRLRADSVSMLYGKEWDFAAAYRFSESVSFRLQLASFRSALESARPSAERYYLSLQYDY